MHNSRYKLDRSTLVQNLPYADDILLTSSNIENLECLVTSLNNTCAKFGLKMNLKKKKFMSISPNKTTRLNITPTLQMSDDTNIQRVSQFKYLGSILRSDNSVDAEVESRINRAAQVFSSISRLVWYQNKIKVSTKIKLFKSVIIPTLLYGSETWNLLNTVADWRTAARDRKQWRNNIKKLLHDLNAQKELDEKAKKDFVKIQKNIANNQTCNIATSTASLVCSFPGCNKVAANKTGLANHIRQKHRTQISVQCENCGLNFKKQGIYNHRKKCSTNSSTHLPLGGQNALRTKVCVCVDYNDSSL